MACEINNVLPSYSLHSSTDDIQSQSASFSNPCFMELMLLAAWNIWKERNNLIFNGIQPEVLSWKRNLKLDLSLHLPRLKEIHRPLVQSWIDLL